MYIAPDHSFVNDIARVFDASCLFQLVVDGGPGQVLDMAEGIDDLNVLRMVVDKFLFIEKTHTCK